VEQRAKHKHNKVQNLKGYFIPQATGVSERLKVSPQRSASGDSGPPIGWKVFHQSPRREATRPPLFSDSTAALTSIFDPGPHACQDASLIFRSNMLELFKERRNDIVGRLVWTPGHGGLDQMSITDKNAKAAANRKIPESGYLLPLFVSRSAALTEIEVVALRDWHAYLNDLEDKDASIFRPKSGFKPFTDGRKTSTFLKLKPQKWFKRITRPLMSQLSQMCTNHAPTGEYFKQCVFKYQDKPSSFFQCRCKNAPYNYPATRRTRDHIIRACPLFEDARDKLRKVFPMIDNPRVTLAKLVRKQTIEHTLEFLKAGPFSRKHAPYEPP